MAKVPNTGSPDTRRHIPSRFAGTTLLEHSLLMRTKNNPIRILPDINIVKIGGQSCIDYGAAVMLPLIKEIVSVRKRYNILLVTGGGTRARHVYDIALNLGLPTGLLASLGEQVAHQNATILFGLLAKNGGVLISKEQIKELPMLVNQGYIPIMSGMPPYHWWEPPPEVGSIPMHRTDVGAYLLAEVLGAKRMIYVKDEDGLYTDNPKTNPKARFIPKIDVDKLIAMNLPDCAVERPVLTMMQRARFVKKIQIINGRVKGNLTDALAGKRVGSVVWAS